jgi:hypothetical protein
MKNKIELIPYPKFEDVFVKETDPKAKFVFLPLVTMKILDHEKIGTKTFHLISLWDTGDYDKDYFGSFRTDVNEISFNIVEDKLEYKDEIKFPKIEFLEKAYNIIIADFEKQKDYYLENLEYDLKSVKIRRGGKLIIEKIPEFGDFESRYYFERITSALLSRYRFEKYGIVNCLFDDNSYYIYKITNGKYSDEVLKNSDFNKLGKINFIDNLLENPEFIQNDEFPQDTLFIGQIDESEYISSNSTNTYLFYDPVNNKQVQILQWD